MQHVHSYNVVLVVGALSRTSVKKGFYEIVYVLDVHDAHGVRYVYDIRNVPMCMMSMMMSCDVN